LPELPPAVAAAFSSEVATATPTPRSPFIPAAAWPVTVHRNSYLPARESGPVSVADCPCFSSFVDFPKQAFVAPAAPGTGIVQTLKLWNATPMFVTLKVIVPVGTIEVFDSLKASSEGLPAITVITLTLLLVEWL